MKRPIPKVFQYALEGERETTSGDGVNPGTENYAVIYFHIRGQKPKTVTLYLRGDKFSTAHYTEMGEHAHGLSVAGTLGGPIDPATSASKPNTDIEIGDPNTTGAPTPHQHTDFEGAAYTHFNDPRKHSAFTMGGVGDPGWGNIVDKVSWPDHKDNNGNPDPLTAVIQGATPHVHKHDHTHSFSFTPGSSFVSPSGVADPAFPPGGAYSARSGAPLTYVNDLLMLIDGLDQTNNILTQLTSSDPTGYVWTQLGDGTVNHPLIVRGTGPIKLDILPRVSFTAGEHRIEIHSKSLKDSSGTPVPTGGRILYNLYLE